MTVYHFGCDRCSDEWYAPTTNPRERCRKCNGEIHFEAVGVGL